MKRCHLIYFLIIVLSGFFAINICAETPQRKLLRELSHKAQSGDPESIYRLAYLYDIGYDSIPIDTMRSTQLYQQAADMGWLPAMNYLGFRYYNGQGVERDVKQGISLIEKAAEMGDLHAANNMGWLMIEGNGIEHDPQKGIYWLEKAAGGNIASAQSMLADILSDNKYLPADTLKAAELYTLAIHNGMPQVQQRLLNLMIDKWRALPVDSIVNLGLEHYTHGAPMIGVDLFLIAADSLSPRALTLLGDAYTRAYGANYSYQKSLESFLQAALLGDAPAQFFIGETLQIFPDALEDEAFHKLKNAEILESPEAHTAIYWLEKATIEGINTAEEAANAMLRPQQNKK